MCGIIGFFSEGSEFRLSKGLELIKERGKDAYGFYDGKKLFTTKDLSQISIEAKPTQTIIGHCLHSMVGFLPQPLKGKGVLAINCEIYNWEELNKKHDLDAMSDSELVLRLLDKFGTERIKEALDELDGVYAFAYWMQNRIFLARDILGQKPLWFSSGEDFAFASEKKALLANGIKNPEELNPRQMIIYDTSSKDITKARREFFKTVESDLDDAQIRQRNRELVSLAIKKMLPKEKFGILFSGGLDSTVIAKICQDQKREFVCYAVGFEEEGKESEDLVFAKKVAQEHNFELRIINPTIEELGKKIRKVVELIEDNNVTKVSVGLTMYLAFEAARKDNVRVVFSGLGSEELFAGYERHKRSADINKECLSGFRKIYERDLYRDDVLSMNNNVELRLPFLDKELVRFSLTIPARLKISDDSDKIILREFAKEIGISKDVYGRKKRAAQYGSRIMKAIDKLSRKNGFASKSDYLKQFHDLGNQKLGVLFSSGKDSMYALHIMKKQNYDIRCLITIVSENLDSYMFHTPNISLSKIQAEALGIPLLECQTRGIKEEELDDLRSALIKAKEIYQIEGVVTGAIFSTYQRDRIESVCDDIGLKIFSPLWHTDQEKEIEGLLNEGYRFILSSVAAYGLDKTWLGRVIGKEDVERLKKLKEKFGINVAGEGGEFESLVIDGPMFKKRIEITSSSIISEDENTARFVVKDARLVDKD